MTESIRHQSLVRGLIASFAIGMLAGSATAQAPPNIILILADDMSWNGTSVPMDPTNPLSASDFYQTPSLERLAAEGMRFSNAYSAASICSPTRAALQTGKSPAQLSFTDIARASGVRNFNAFPLKPPQWRAVPTSEDTLPKRVKAADPRYVTAHLGKWHLAPGSPLDLGYDIGFDPVRAASVGTEDPGSVFAKTEAALSFLDDREAGGEPFFLQLSHFAVHDPIEGQAEVIEKYEALPSGTVHNNPVYAAFTEALDTGVGMVLDRVRDLGMEENTYVIYASDNGARYGDSSPSPLGGTKGHLMDGGIRTPLFIKGPGIEANSHSDTPVTTVDLFSTVSDLAGNQTPFAEGVEGASLVPLLENGGELPDGIEFLERQYSEDGAIFFWQPHNMSPSTNYRIRPMAAVRKDNFKLLRLFGENGNPDTNYLFDFDNSLLESETGGSLDVSAQHPEAKAELMALLDDWAEQADAIHPYDVALPVEILWRADELGDHPDRWRAVTNVDHRWRETFEVVDAAEEPSQISASNHLSGAPQTALFFDGGDRLSRRFFDVADKDGRSSLGDSRFDNGVPDNDRSVTFDVVFRVGSLGQEHILFETGDPVSGLSVTLGDGDNDGTHDEIRFRILSDDGQTLTVTGEIDHFASPTNDFVHLTAVYDDDPDNRYAELYVNGASIGRVDGAPGETGSLRWDLYQTGFESANIGGRIPEDIGANAGSGDLPFTGAWFHGEISQLRFLNYSIGAAEVQANYAELLDAPDAGLVDLLGDTAAVVDRPVSVAAGDYELDAALRVMRERVDTLDEDLAVDVIAADGGTFSVDEDPLPGGVLSAGADYTSYLLHFDAETDVAGDQQLAGLITFSKPILGLLIAETTLDASELILGVAGEFDLGNRALPLSGVGDFAFSSDRLSLYFDITVDQLQLTQLRVLTEADPITPVPGDYDGNGVVEVADYLVWRDEFGAEGDSPADGNGDGQVDAADFNLWRDNLGATSGSLTIVGSNAPSSAQSSAPSAAASAAEPTPEPASWWLAASLAGVLRRRRR